jgi:transposase-like protein
MPDVHTEKDIMSSTARRAAVRWSEIVERLEASGQPLGEFAATHGLNPNTLAKWWRRLRQPPSKTSRPAFVEVLVAEPEPSVVLIALDELPAHIVVHDRTDLALTRKVLEALC